MIHTLHRRGIMLGCLFLSFFFNSCTRPEDHAINVPLKNSDAVVGSISGAETYTIEISGMMFHPKEITVHEGDTVVWKNNDLVTHCVTEEISKAWTSSQIIAGASWKMVAKTTSDYFCAIHQVMKGKIVVK